jgi:hypothetical protein
MLLHLAMIPAAIPRATRASVTAMKGALFFIAALLLAVHAAFAQAQAEWRNKEGTLPGAFSPSSTAIKTTNGFNNFWMWVTVQDLGKTTNLAWGCVSPGMTRQWTASGINAMSLHQLRAQIMEREGCVGRQLCDTTMEVVHGAYYTLHPNKKNPSSCYWDETPQDVRHGGQLKWQR